MPLSHFIIGFGQMRNREEKRKEKFFFNFELTVIKIIANSGKVGRDENIIRKIDYFNHTQKYNALQVSSRKHAGMLYF